MKLSQIRMISWSMAILVLGLSGFLCYRTYLKTQRLKVKTVDSWNPQAYQFEGNTTEFMNARALQKALSVITHVDEVIIDVPDPIPTPATTGLNDQKPVKPPPPPLSLKLILVEYDETKNGRHLAYIKDSSEIHPYLVLENIREKKPNGEKVLLGRLIKIKRNQVTIRRPDNSDVILKTESVGLLVKTDDGRGVVDRAPPPRPRPTPPIVKKNRPKPPKNRPKKRNPGYRTVPDTRLVILDEDWGIEVIEYDAGKDDKNRRFAANKEIKQVLQENQYRLLSDQTLTEVVGDNDNVMGLQVDFLNDAALLKKYGFKSGDIITHIDGVAITSQEQGLALYKSWGANKRRVKINFIRQGQKYSVTFEMDDFPDIKAPPKK